jgi:hypothetical protein
VRSKFSIIAIFVTIFGADAAVACDQTIVLTNWKSCAVGPLSEEGGEQDWKAVPSWARDSKIRPFFFDDPRMLAEHGLCNSKFKRVVMCLPGWQESRDKNACWYLICSGYQASKD